MHFEKKNRGDSRRKSLICKFSEEIQGDSRRKIKIEEIRGVSSCGNPAFVSDRIARAFNRSGATRAVVLEISKAFDRVWYAGLLHKLKSYGISGRYLAFFLVFLVIDNFDWFWMESLHKNIQLMGDFLKALFLVLHFSYYALMIFLTM